VIYPGPIFSNGPPPGISIQMFIFCLEAGVLMNSKKDPQESAVKAPKMQPKALSSNESFYIDCKRY
jgi:hypothetical protein